jgi:nicotinamidase-related amidase
VSRWPHVPSRIARKAAEQKKEHFMSSTAVQPRTALIVGDVQNGIVKSYGNDDAFVERVARAIEAARAAGVVVVYVRIGFRDNYLDVSPRNKVLSGVRANGALKQDSDDTQIDARIIPQAGDAVVTKRRVSAFAGSDLDVVLRSQGVTHLVLSGIATSGVVLSTVRAAADLDYALTVLSDGVKDNDEEVHRILVEKLFPRQATVITTAEWINGL